MGSVFLSTADTEQASSWNSAVIKKQRSELNTEDTVHGNQETVEAIYSVRLDIPSNRKRGTTDHVQVKQDITRNWDKIKDFLANKPDSEIKAIRDKLKVKYGAESGENGSDLIDLLTDKNTKAEDIDEECNYVDDALQI